MALLTCCRAASAEGEGQADLDKAIEAKVSATTLREMGVVIDLCQSSLEKGLDEESTKFAESLLGATLLNRGQAYAEAILGRVPPDPRWPALRQRALADLETLLGRSSDVAQAHLLVGKLQSMPGGDRDKAKTALDDAIRLFTDDPASKSDALIHRAVLQPDNVTRIADLAAAAEADPMNPAPYRARAGVLMLESKADAALADFDKALELDPGHAQTHEARGICLIVLDRRDEGRAALEKSAELAPDIASPYVQLSRLSLQEGNAAAALEEVNAALERNSDNLPALLVRGPLLAQEGDLDGALADLSRILALRPGLPQALRTRVAVLVAAGKLDDAIVDLNALKEQDPDDLNTRLQLGALYTGQEKPAEAVAEYDAILERDPQAWQAFRGRADALLNAGQQAKAIEDYRRVIDIQPEESGTLNNLAWVLSTSPDDALRDGARAIELATKACELTDFEQPHILSTLAAAHAEAGDFKSAIEWSEKAVAKAAGSDELQDNLEKELESYRADKPWRELKGSP